MAALDEFFRTSVMTTLTIYAVLGIVVIAAVILAVRAFLRAYLKYHGMRVVTCPETERYAAVEMDAPHAALTCLLGPSQLRLSSCSRWPERQDCPQDCIWQIDVSPIGCRLRDIVTGWYVGKECVFCHRLFEQIHWLEYQPALLSPDGRIVEWDTIRPEAIPDALVTHKPVCSQCKFLEGFRKEHPELVTERPWAR
jgi:hypothetical protein